MNTLTVLELMLGGAMLTAGGVAVGKLWGSYGRQTSAACSRIRNDCRDLWHEMFNAVDVRLEAMTDRLERIENKVDRLNGKTQ